jgi:hypothetical protein
MSKKRTAPSLNALSAAESVDGETSSVAYLPPPELGPIAVTEALTVPCDHFGEYDYPTTLWCRLRGGRDLFAVTWSRAQYEGLRATGGLVLGPPELMALCLAAENDRASHVTLRAWLAELRAHPSLPLTASKALGGLSAVDVPSSPRMPLGRVLWLWGAELLSVTVDGTERKARPV